MLTEEAHHMFVGESGIARILERTCELLRESTGLSEDVRKVGGIDLEMIQRHLNAWFSMSLDLHGSEVSTNAASYFANGLKGRAYEESFEDHKALHGTYQVDGLNDGQFFTRDVPMRSAMNEILRDWYVADCRKGVERWNKILEKHGLSDRLYLPERKFNRHIGIYSETRFDPWGHVIKAEEWERQRTTWLPTPADKAYLKNIMTHPVYEPGKFANYIAPPSKGINRLPVDFEYVRREA
jgi:benzoyl-CoA 2,3-dioxygenase component B